jgi:hypothetical protein
MYTFSPRTPADTPIASTSPTVRTFTVFLIAPKLLLYRLYVPKGVRTGWGAGGCWQFISENYHPESKFYRQEGNRGGGDFWAAANQSPQNRNLKTDFLDIMVSKVLCYLPFSLNQPLKSAVD